MDLHLIKYLSIRKTVNLLKLWFSYILSVIIARPIHWGMPAAISIEPTNRCNLKCPECPTGNGQITRKKLEIDINLNKKIINEIGKYLWVVNYYFQGEPFLNPQLFELIQYASEKKIFTITSTNGHFLDAANCEKIVKSSLDRLIVSLDGITPEIYNNYRKNGNFEKVVEGIRTLVEVKKRLTSKSPQVIVQFLVFKSNEHQIADAKQFVKKLGVDKLIFKSAQFYDLRSGNQEIPDIPKYSRYKQNPDGSWSVKSKPKNRCWRMWSNPVITSSGTVAVCCFDKNAKFKIGSAKENDFHKLWNSKSYVDFRKIIIQDRKTIDICTNCTEGLTNIFL